MWKFSWIDRIRALSHRKNIFAWSWMEWTSDGNNTILTPSSQNDMLNIKIIMNIKQKCIQTYLYPIPRSWIIICRILFISSCIQNSIIFQESRRLQVHISKSHPQSSLNGSNSPYWACSLGLCLSFSHIRRMLLHIIWSIVGIETWSYWLIHYSSEQSQLSLYCLKIYQKTFSPSRNNIMNYWLIIGIVLCISISNILV